MPGADPVRILAIMGSGETSPTMVTTHREIAARFPGGAPRAVLLDTPYGFQENSPDLSRRAVDYFARRVRLPVEVVDFPGPLAADPAKRAAWPTPGALARLRAAHLVFSGPGSPSYALSVWRGSPLPEALRAKLADGGAVVFASAAALTLGRFTLPVYEIYKAGQPPHWLDGLDLLAVDALGDCAVIPHFDNAEGGTHDTRYCYMGERRLATLEAELPDTGWILGVDEHTALVLDLGAGQALVTGRGAVTVRRRGAARRLPAGARLALGDLPALARALGRGGPGPSATGSAPGPAGTATRGPGGDEPTGADRVGPPRPGDGPAAPLLEEVGRLERAFGDALDAGRADQATEAILALDRTIAEWAADTLESDEPDRARAVLHALVHRLGEAAARGVRDPREALTPMVEALIAFRAELRADRAWELADRLRARLAEAGVELRDTPGGTVWDLGR